MASLTEQLLEKVSNALLAVPQIAGTADKVARAREDAYSDRESGSITIKAADESSQMKGETVDDNELTVDLEIYVSAEDGEVWETLADAIFVQADARLMRYSGWPSWLARVRRVSKRFGGDDGDRTPGLLTVRYVFRFLTDAQAADAEPKF